MENIQAQQAEQNQAITTLQNQIAALQQQLNNASQANNNLATSSALKGAKPDKFSGRNARSWLKSLQNIFSSQAVMPNDVQKINYAVSYLSEDGLQWWELVNINNNINITTFEDF